MAKIRMDFVTNSSSSSYIIGSKEEPTTELVIKAFAVPEKSFMFQITKDIARTLIGNIEEVDYCKNYANKYAEDWLDNYKELLNQGFKFYYGSVSNDSGEGIQDYLCDLDIEFKDDNLIIIKDGGY